MGVDPVELRESSRTYKNKKIPKYSGLDVGVDPVGLRENPRLLKRKKPRKIRGLLWELRDSNPRPSACKEKKTSFQIFNN